MLASERIHQLPDNATWCQKCQKSALHLSRKTMSFSINAPEQFNFNKPEQWPNWIRRFERYRMASKLSEEEGKHQVNTLMYLIGQGCPNFLVWRAAFGKETSPRAIFPPITS